MRPSMSFDLKARETRSISALGGHEARWWQRTQMQCGCGGDNDLSLSSRALKISDSHVMTRDLSHVFQSVEERDENKRLKLIPSSLS